MKVLVDTSIWSLALRRKSVRESKYIVELRNLIMDNRVQMIGPIRQEILSGIRDEVQFLKLESHLNAFPDMIIDKQDYVEAARFFNLCRGKGIQGSNTDFLICAIASRHKLEIFTTDKDFTRYTQHLPIKLYGQI